MQASWFKLVTKRLQSLSNSQKIHMPDSEDFERIAKKKLDLDNAVSRYANEQPTQRFSGMIPGNPWMVPTGCLEPMLSTQSGWTTPT